MATKQTLRERFVSAQTAGYHLHLGIEADGELCGCYWWTLCRPGWSGIETSDGDWATQDEVMADACRAHNAETEGEHA